MIGACHASTHRRAEAENADNHGRGEDPVP
jgi:hypothetical protein